MSEEQVAEIKAAREKNRDNNAERRLHTLEQKRRQLEQMAAIRGQYWGQVRPQSVDAQSFARSFSPSGMKGESEFNPEGGHSCRQKCVVSRGIG